MSKSAITQLRKDVAAAARISLENQVFSNLDKYPEENSDLLLFWIMALREKRINPFYQMIKVKWIHLSYMSLCSQMDHLLHLSNWLLFSRTWRYSVRFWKRGQGAWWMYIESRLTIYSNQPLSGSMSGSDVTVDQLKRSVLKANYLWFTARQCHAWQRTGL